MCDLCLPRRRVLLGAAGMAGVAVGATIGLRPGVAGAAPRQAGMPPIVSRAEWGGHLPPTGPIPEEPDVRFLLVHHTVNGNDYGPDQVTGLLEDIYGFHTGPDKGWPDIAYNFLIDRFGTIYEGRTGSLAGPKAADATGGSQGFAQLCCYIGDHSVAPPSDAAFASMVSMLAWLGDRHGLDLSPGATATFVSRGSNRRPAGTEVTTATISGHRDMSSTACPGDFAYAAVADGTYATLATAARATTPPPPTEPPTTAPPPTEAPTTTTASPTTTTSTAPSSTTTSAAPSSTTRPPTDEVAADLTVDDTGSPGPGTALPAAAGAAALTAAALALRTRRAHPPTDP